ncbi:MAG: hypothetical protein J4F36_12475 [Nitrosopumilaceae archaeon]|nr:hypothetical protein [Nitrosopumilaceae archaeon]
MRISSNRNSSCRECKKEWKIGEQIHYDPDTRAMCIDERCFDTQVRKRIEERNEHNNLQSTNDDDKTNSSNEFKLENEDEFRNKIHERLAKYKIIIEESEKFLENHCNKDNKSDAKPSVELILRELL